MPECPDCGRIVSENEVEYECPECGEEDEDGFYTCPDCGTLFYFSGDLWECIHCRDSEFPFFGGRCRCPECGEPLEDESYCFCCGWPNNQGWIGENYG